MPKHVTLTRECLTVRKQRISLYASALAIQALLASPCVFANPQVNTAPSIPPVGQPEAQPAASAGSANPDTETSRQLAEQFRSNADEWAPINALAAPGLTSRFPPISDSILGNKGGWRSELAEKGFNIELRIKSGVTANLRDSTAPKNGYVGQDADLLYGGPSLTIVSDLDKLLGVPNAKMTFVAGSYYTTAEVQKGDNDTSINEISYYQSFLDDSMSVNFGYGPQWTRFVGLFTGGQLVLSDSLSSLIPLQVGLPASPFGSPFFNFQLGGESGPYTKLGISQSISTLGRTWEGDHNGIGFQFHKNNANALYIGEIGDKNESSPDQYYKWIRAGVIYNTSEYDKFDGGKNENKAVYALADFQLTQPDNWLSYRGLYTNIGIQAAPSDVNVYTRSYTAKLYYKAPFLSRPLDATSVSFKYNAFSKDASDYYRSLGVDTQSDQTQVDVQYVAHVASGVYLTPQLSWIHHPSFANDYPDALLASLNFLISF
ncbi:carbohydrate porin [Pseudomonas fluorescens]|uniref:Uncharacterized protein n=1 Tax=Pseudomonas fluorescens TaxID=294 RepID=A0A5E7CFW2_PSEFL|nr:carbohydrate porin [Pseudomonas fluorescens]VVO03617.1 hypothetical protein PS833_02861 [Pseudomonas fluorescens]